MASRFQQRIEHVAHIPIIIDYCDYVQILCGHLWPILEKPPIHPDETK
jgi:hypothetical protein